MIHLEAAERRRSLATGASPWKPEHTPDLSPGGAMEPMRLAQDVFLVVRDTVSSEKRDEFLLER